MAARNRLVAGVGAAVGVRVLERREAMRAVSVPDDVVLLRTIELEQAKLRFRPMDAVLAFGIARDLAVRLPLGGFIPMRAAIVHAIQAAVIEEAIIGRRVPFPGLVADERDFLRHGLLQLL